MDFGGDKEKEEKERPRVGLHAARIYSIVDIGTQVVEYPGKPKSTSRRMIVWWELAQKMADGHPFSVNLEYSQYIASEKSKLRAHLQAWTGKVMDAATIKAFDPRKMMLGKACMVNLVQGTTGNIKVDGLLAIPEGMEKPAAVNPQVYLDLDAFEPTVFEGLYTWVKTKIMASPQYLKLNGEHAADEPGHEDGPPPASEDDIPF